MASRTLSRPLYRLPVYVINGMTVAAGIGVVEVLFTALADPRAAQLAVSGAICASLADRPVTPARSWRTVLFAGSLGCATALAIVLLARHRLVLGLGIVLITLAAQMTLAWGPRARAVAMAAILSIIFTMALPAGQAGPASMRWNVFGVLVYLAWSYAADVALQPRYRTLSLAAALASAANLLRSRAARYAPAPDRASEEAGLADWVRDEAALAERLQAARDMLFAASESARADREIAVLLRLIEMRDTLLASRIDLDLLGADESARRIRTGLVRELQRLAARLDAAALRARGLPLDGLEAPVPCTAAGLFGELQLAGDDLRRRLLPAVIGRVQRLRDDAARIEELLGGAHEAPLLSRAQLRHFVSPEGWPLRALRSHTGLASPVVRHALRAALALGTAYFVALALPWASHPQWLVLSVAVVLQGSLEQTLARRNARVLGTMFGCLLALVLLAGLRSPGAIVFAFVCAVGIAHSFTVERYVVTAVAGTVMALLQAELANPAAQVPIVERLADTVLGAALAWAFSFVLPSWEVRSMPTAIARALAALQDYARQSLRREAGSAVAQRLARRRAYDELGALSAALQRSAVEPARVRPPVRELAALLDHAHRLMAHLSLVRLTLAQRARELEGPGLAAELQSVEARLSAALGADAAPVAAGAPAQVPDALPPDPPADNVRPWFERRLLITLNDAAELARATRRARERLQER